MTRTAASILLVLGVQLVLPLRVVEAHTPPPAYLNLKITDEQAEVLVVVSFDVFRDWFEVEPDTIPADGILVPAQRANVEATLGRWLRVQIDGLTTEGELQDATPEHFEDHLQTWSYVRLRVRYPTEQPPRQVAFAWTHYESNTGWVFDELDAELEAYGVTDYPLFKKREPETLWHRPRESKAPAPVVLPKPIDPPHVVLPTLSIMLLGGFLVLALVSRRRLPRVWLGLPVVILVALALFQVAPLDVPLPWRTGLERPPDDEALTIFASLHRGVYSAVDGETEDAIYDDLAQSVTGELLPELYMDIHRSLILQEEGGAVAKIQKTEIVKADVLPVTNPDAAWFDVRARWRVEGKVGHWGHTHQRINEYLANVTIIAVDGHWKIAGIEVLDESRLDDGKPAR